MKYFININQLVLADTGLDLIDAAIIDYLRDLHGSVSEAVESQRITYQNRTWTWVNYKQLLKQMPLLGIKSIGALTPRIKKIVEAGYFDTYRRDGRVYVRALPKLDELFTRMNDDAKAFTKMNGGVHDGERGHAEAVHTNERINKLFDTYTNDSIAKSLNNDSPTSPSTPDSKASKLPPQPNPVHQLVDYIRTVQGHAQYANPAVHYRHAKLILSTYTLDEAKQAADLMLREDFWKSKGITTKNLADHIHRFIGEVRANPETSDNQACLATVRYMTKPPLDHINDIGRETNSHWMALEKVGKEIAQWVIDHRRTKLNRKEWLLAELRPQADALRKQFGDFVFIPPVAPEILAWQAEEKQQAQWHQEEQP